MTHHNDESALSKLKEEPALADLDADLLSDFARLDTGFDERQFAMRVIQNASDVSAYLGRLQEASRQLEASVHSHVTAHHRDLLSHAVGVEKLESVLEMMQARTGGLLTAVTKIARRVRTPHEALVSRVAQLRRMQLACEVLRKAVRVVQLATRLQALPKDELVKGSQLVSELEFLFDSMDWAGIEVLETNRRITTQAREQLEEEAWKMLSNAYELSNTSQLGTSLQVFHNLGCLDRVVRRLLKDWREELARKVASSLDMTVLMQQAAARAAAAGSVSASASESKGPGRAAMPASAGQNAAFRAGLWTNLDNCLDQLYQVLFRVRLLARILAKRRDLGSERSLLELLQQSGAFDGEAEFTTWAAGELQQAFQKAADGSSFFKSAFESEFPKLLKLFADFVQRAAQGDTNESAALQSLETSPFWACLQPLETAYLSRSLSRLFDPVELSFAATEAVPGQEQLEAMVRAMTSELTFASGHPALLRKVARNVAKSLRLLAAKAEQNTVTDGEASQVVGPLTPGQQLNVRIVNALDFFLTFFRKEIAFLKLPPAALVPLEEPLAGIEALMRAAVQPLLQSISDALEAILITVHHEDFGLDLEPGEEGPTSERPSLYMQELSEFVLRVRQQYLSQFLAEEFVFGALRPHVARAIDVFLIQASLVRPLGSRGKLRLASDCSHLETALAPLCPRLADTGPPYRRLRALRPLLFQALEQVPDLPGLGDILPRSLVLHHLFSRAPPELLSPHQSAAWSIGRYSNWLLSHPDEADRLQFVRGAIDAYRHLAHSKGARQYCAAFPIMTQLLNKPN